MSIRSAPISGVVDVNERTSVTGVGINLAHRVMDYGDAGHTLVSQRVAETSNVMASGRSFVRSVQCDVKHGVRDLHRQSL
ncbi:MAG TPA: hypothetical protein VIH43_02660 [Chthoniobacterales bacterium]|jgi:class 3 adenylate cyclase